MITDFGSGLRQNMSQILCPIVNIKVSRDQHTQIYQRNQQRHDLVTFSGSKLVIIFLIHLYDYHIEGKLFLVSALGDLQAKGISKLKGMI